MKRIRSHKRKTAISLLFLFTFQLVPYNAFALTGGPSQPEASSFQPIGVSDMVDLFSGDFQYNLPLLDVDGYPLNLSYSSQLSNDMEASWVGLGWNLNPGAITRSMRGIPDEFKGDIVHKDNNMNPNKNISVNLAAEIEKLGFEKKPDLEATSSGAIELSTTASLCLGYNNYAGFSLSSNISSAYTTSNYTSGKKTSENSYSLGLSSSAEGFGIKPNASFSKMKWDKDWKDYNYSALNIGLDYNSRGGLQELTFKAQRNKFDASHLGESINIGLNSYTPYIETPMKNVSVSFTYKGGPELTGIFPNTSATGVFSWQGLKYKSADVPAYGYLNTESANVNCLLDINREKDGSFTKNTPMLPMTSYTYDLFSVNGQGISGTFRPYRSEVGNIYDRSSDNASIGVGAGIDLGMGNAVKNGFNIDVNYSSSNSGKWDDHYNNSAKDHFTNRGNPGVTGYETYAYKQLGEMTPDDETSFVTQYGGTDPVRIGIQPADFTYRTYPSILDKQGSSSSFPSDNYRKQRIKRNQQFSILTREEVERYGLENHLAEMYAAPSYHPGEITVLKDDGARYVYGIAAYNYTTEETSFSVGRRKKDAQQMAKLECDIDRNNGLVKYDTEDNSTENDRGLDNYYSNTIIPAYAHTFLLTAILSTDYVDIDGIKGPSKGDIGNYTKFIYDKMPDKYKWRVPFQQYQAHFNEGLYTDEDDNQGNYTYGEKEQWYLSYIETKNSLAFFTVEDRKDGHGVMDKDGGMGEETTKLLRKITLYSKQDYDLNNTSAVPIKEVHFEYTYDLCPNVLNNDGTSGTDDNSGKGKLTLSKVYFTYGSSLRGKFNPYEFEYNDINPDYGMQNNDRWGNYKPNDPALPNNEFPYVKQDRDDADDNCQAWTLKAITLPSGGRINVEYEADDYAYVQDHYATQMFMVNSFVDEIDPMSDMFSSDHNTTISYAPSILNRQFLVFKLSEEFAPTGATDPEKETDRKKFKQMYLKDIKDLYFRIKVDITNKDDYEYVSGYCELENTDDIDNAFMVSDGTSGNYTHGYIKIKNVDIGDGNGLGLNVHPMAKAAWQFGRMHLNRELYGRVDDNTCNILKFLNTIKDATFIVPLMQGLQGQNGYLMDKDCGKEVLLDHSFIRLYNPEGRKLGGGSRVKRISINDRWSTMIPGGDDPDDSEYGQEYTYTTTDAETGLEISSGVASNEPSVGADENTLKEPIYFGDKAQKLLAPDDRFYMEAPIGESFYPTPVVGYSRVRVKNISHENVTRHATGYVINEFYTARDFPTIAQCTGLEAKQTTLSPLLKAFKKYTRCYMAASQGFSIELNDMHGKPKAIWVYAENSSVPISGTEYRYKCAPYQGDGNFAKGYRLSNTVQVLYPDGTVQQKELGVEYDIINDFRQETTNTYIGGFRGNLDNFMASVVPLSLPTLFSSAQSDKRGFRSAVTTKVINRYGIVDEVIAYDLGSKVGTRNLAYDSETGDVILTQTKNEFEDDIYSFTYPAHWYYKNMGPAYKNYKLSFTGISFSAGGVASIDNAEDWFIEGDEVISGTEKGWVVNVDNVNDSIAVINEVGKPYKPLSSGQDITIIRSGRRNILKANIGSLVAMSNPLNGLRTNAFSKVINAASQVFRDDWKTYCECFAGEASLMKISDNPYATGRKGIWRPFKAYTFLTNRELSIKNNNTNIRNDGSFTNYSPFWKWDGDSWASNTTGWTWTSEITEFSPFGMELENMDPLNRYSAATYGYNNSLPLSVAANARYSDIGFDGFEDYNFSTCSNDHFSYRLNSGNVVQGSSHTGQYSIRASALTSIILSKPIEDCNPE